MPEKDMPKTAVLVIIATNMTASATKKYMWHQITLVFTLKRHICVTKHFCETRDSENSA